MKNTPKCDYKGKMQYLICLEKNHLLDIKTLTAALRCGYVTVKNLLWKFPFAVTHFRENGNLLRTLSIMDSSLPFYKHLLSAYCVRFWATRTNSRPLEPCYCKKFPFSCQQMKPTSFKGVEEKESNREPPPTPNVFPHLLGQRFPRTKR